MSNQSTFNASGLKDVLKWLILFGLFAIPFLTLYVENSYFFPFITGKNFVFRIIVEIITGLWVVLALLEAEYRPRFSWILSTFGIFLTVIFLADIHGVDPHAALWSNYERMDGFVTLAHVFSFFVVLGAMLRTPKAWSYFLHTSVVVAGLVALKGLAQLSGAEVRVDSTLGNAAYMAVYMLFHIFILFYLFVRSRDSIYKAAYAFLSLLFIFVLLQTGTRGTAIGLIVGVVVMTTYIALFSTRNKHLQKYAAGALVLLVLGIGGFMAVRDTSYVQHNPALSRIANISIAKDLTIRTVIWGMAVSGVKEQPLLGWGQSNFNYVFNAQYDPRMYNQEQWFDRVHDIFFDWLIAGGVLGCVSYFSIFAALIYYLIWRPIFAKDETLTVVERSILLGLVAGYLTHNLVVFDNIVSYIFFASIIALLHSRVSIQMPAVTAWRIPAPIVTQMVLPVVVLIVGLVVYTVNVPSMLAAHDILNALQSKDRAAQLTIFDQALKRGSFARQEIVEQFTQLAMMVAAEPSVSADIKAAYKTQAETELLALIQSKPADARLYVFLGGFYRAENEPTKAQAALATARTLSPLKQAIIIQQGAIELGLGNKTAARDFFKAAFELNTQYDDARLYYAATLFMTNASTTAVQLIAEGPSTFKAKFAASDFALGAVNSAGDLPFLAELYEQRLLEDASVPQNWASLAYVYYELKENDKAIDTLTRAKEAVPSFAPTAECISGNIHAGRAPETGCK